MEFLEKFNIKGASKSAVVIGLISVVVIIGSSLIGSKILDLIIFLIVLLGYVVCKIREEKKK